MMIESRAQLWSRSISRCLPQVGVTAMLVASKYEEIWAPEVRDFVYISDTADTREQILSMEKLMLNTLQFNLTLPTSYMFLARFLKAASAHSDKNSCMLCTYLIELSLQEHTMLKFNYSTIAAAATYVALTALHRPDPFCKTLAKHSGFTKEVILPCAAALVQLMQKAPTNNLNAVYKKYSNAKYLEICKTEPPVEILAEVDSSLLG